MSYSIIKFNKFLVAYPALGFMMYGAYIGYKRSSKNCRFGSYDMVKSISNTMIQSFPTPFLSFMMLSSLIAIITI